jgi:putative transposase
MQIIENQLYHVYNQGNNREKLFYTSENYIHFLHLTRKFIFPHCDILAYCLMPNHFHFLIYATKDSAVKIKIGHNEMSVLANGFRKLLSSYCQAINKQEDRTGSLFRQKTKAKNLEISDIHYPFQCFHYIHQNPLKASLIRSLDKWPYSSFRDYAALRQGTLCNQKLAMQLLDFNKESFISDAHAVISEVVIKKFYE